MKVSEHANYENIAEAYNFVRDEVLEVVKQIVSENELDELREEQGINTELLHKLVQTHLARMEESVLLLNKLVTLHRQGKLDQTALLALGTWG